MEQLKIWISETIKESGNKHIDVIILSNMLDMTTKFDKQEIEKVLFQLEKEGEIVAVKKNKYISVEAAGLVKGTLQGHERGFCFLRPSDKEVEDIFVPSKSLFGALNKDIVLVEIVDLEKREGSIVKILERGESKLVGYFQKVKLRQS